jgi:hypothetical protein
MGPRRSIRISKGAKDFLGSEKVLKGSRGLKKVHKDPKRFKRVPEGPQKSNSQKPMRHSWYGLKKH